MPGRTGRKGNQAHTSGSESHTGIYPKLEESHEDERDTTDGDIGNTSYRSGLTSGSRYDVSSSSIDSLQLSVDESLASSKSDTSFKTSHESPRLGAHTRQQGKVDPPDGRRGLHANRSPQDSQSRPGGQSPTSAHKVKARQEKADSPPQASQRRGYAAIGAKPARGKVEADSGSWCEFPTLIIVLCIGVLAVLLGSILLKKSDDGMDARMTDQDSSMSQREKLLSNFDVAFKPFQAEFPSQSRRLWATIKASSKAVLRSDDPLQPGIILLAGSETEMATVNCLAKKLAILATGIYEDKNESAYFEMTHEHDKLSAADVKLKLDEAFRAGFGTGGHVAVLQDLHKVPGKAAMMLHAYCDNESAPFKDAIIILIARIETSAEFDDSALGRFLEGQLRDYWETDIGYDNAMALLSRVANNIAVVKPETAETLFRNKCT